MGLTTVKKTLSTSVMTSSTLQLMCVTLIGVFHIVLSANWEEWWTYDGISGPEYWGIMNPTWTLCNNGRRQSPVDVDPDLLLYDRNLKSVHIDKHRITGFLSNSGHSVVFRVNSSSLFLVNITGGPLSYTYRFQELHLHFGLNDDRGSEHTIGGLVFPAELQLFGYNVDIHNNLSEAINLRNTDGIVAISILLQIGDLSNTELRILTSQLHHITHRGQTTLLEHISIKELLPDTESFLTYEGSLTTPGCYETVTWIVMNKPIYITKQQLFQLRSLKQGYEKNPKAPLGNNFRTTFPLNNRVIRTNIDFHRKAGLTCPKMEGKVFYKGELDSMLLIETIYHAYIETLHPTKSPSLFLK